MLETILFGRINIFSSVSYLISIIQYLNFKVIMFCTSILSFRWAPAIGVYLCTIGVSIAVDAVGNLSTRSLIRARRTIFDLSKVLVLYSQIFLPFSIIFHSNMNLFTWLERLYSEEKLLKNEY